MDKETRVCRHKGKPCEDTGRRWASASPGERPQEKPPASTLSVDLSFQNCEKINACCLSHLVCGFCYGSPSKLIYICIAWSRLCSSGSEGTVGVTSLLLHTHTHTNLLFEVHVSNFPTNYNTHTHTHHTGTSPSFIADFEIQTTFSFSSQMSATFWKILTFICLTLQHPTSWLLWPHHRPTSPAKSHSALVSLKTSPAPKALNRYSALRIQTLYNLYKLPPQLLSLHFSFNLFGASNSIQTNFSLLISPQLALPSFYPI